MCVYIAIIAIILPVMLWRMDSALVLQYNGCRFKSKRKAGEALRKGQCTQEQEAQYVNAWGSGH